MQPVPPISGTGVAGYKVADYLDQHGRRSRKDQLGPASLWNALIAHAATVRDQVRLGKAGRDRGLYRHAALLWTAAAALGSADAAGQLVALLRQASPSDTVRAADWAAREVGLDNPDALAALMWELPQAWADDAVTTLARRTADAGGDGVVGPPTVAWLPMLRQAEARDALVTLLARDPASQVSLDDPDAVASLLWELRRAGARDAVTTLVGRAANAGMFRLFLEVRPGEPHQLPVWS